MKEKIELLAVRLAELGKEMSDPDVHSDQKRYRDLAREYTELSNIMEVGERYLKILNNFDGNQEIIDEGDDPEIVEMAEAEQDELAAEISKLEDELKLLLVPTHPEDHKNAIMEIRAGAGGDEAAIFAGDLYRMYSKFCERRNFQTDILNSNPSERGGFKEIVFSIEGENVYGILKYESGVHRVQRVPDTETQGRVHTSAASVVVLPEAEDVDVHIDPNEIRIDVYRSSGPGGQSVNTTDSAVRITHIPTGLVVSCQDEKSQLKNKVKALKVLRSRLLDMAVSKQQSAVAKQRKTMVGGGDRSAKIRTYNYPQGRITDHRINLTLYKLDRVLEGEIDDLIEGLSIADRTEQLEQLNA